MFRASSRWALPCLALLVPYIYFSALQRYYMFNGDHAIQIIMAHYFRWESADFYYWGQNRLGSLIPLLLLVPVQLLKWPGLLCAVACSLVLYLFGLGLLLAHARGRVEKMAALVSFFLMPIKTYSFLLYTGHPYTPAMALVLGAFAVAFAAPASHARMFFVGSLFAVAFWVSEASVAALPPLVFLLFERRKVWRVTLARLVTLGLGTIWILPFVVYWRRQVGYEGHDAEYLLLATPEMVQLGLAKFLPQFLFMVNSEIAEKGPFVWLATGAIVLVNPLILCLRKSWVDETKDNLARPLLTFLALHNCCYFLIVLVSRHSYYGTGQIHRYWVPVIVYSIYELFVLSARVLRQGRAGASSLALVVGATGVALVVLAFQKWPSRSNGEAFREIEGHWADLESVRERGATHVTGSYWRSLPLTVLSEFEVLAVPSDFSRTARFQPEFSPQARRDNPGAYMQLE